MEEQRKRPARKPVVQVEEAPVTQARPFTFRTTPPATYLSPSEGEMKEVAARVGLARYSKDLAADLANLAAGGRITLPSGYRSEVMHRVEERLPAPNSCGEWSITILRDGKKTSVTTKDRQEAIRARTNEAMEYHRNVCDFLGSIDLAKFPGATPLEQAMSCLKLLSKKQGGEASGSGDGEPLPIFQDDNKQPEGVAASLHDTMETVDSLSEEERQMLDPKGENVTESNDGDKQQEGKPLSMLKVAEDLVGGSDKRIMLDISRKLDKFTQLQVRKQEKLEADPAGEEVRQRPIKNLGELPRVAKSAWGMRQQNPTYFLYQAVTSQLPIRERVTRIVRKQAIFILVDGSGSMNGRKHWKATGVVMNRLKAVLKGDAEVFISVFDTSMGKVERASNPTGAKTLIEKFKSGNFSGGGTDIAAAVKAAHKHVEELIKKGEALYRPEVVVLTDDDTSVTSLTRSDIPNTRVHGFAMECNNKTLVEFARSTGGVGIEKF